MVIPVRLRVDVQGERKFSVTFETRTLFVTFEALGGVADIVLCSAASCFLLRSLTVAGDEYPVFARRLLLTWKWGMACL